MSFGSFFSFLHRIFSAKSFEFRSECERHDRKNSFKHGTDTFLKNSNKNCRRLFKRRYSLIQKSCWRRNCKNLV